MEIKKKYFIFSIIVLFNIVLKSLFADHASFNYDEIISVKDTLLHFGHIKHEAEWDNNPPFFYYCLWVWHSIIPISEFNSRLLSIVFVSFSIGFSFLFSIKYLNNRTSFFSVVLLSLSNFLTYYSLETRTYSLVVFLVLLSTLQLFKYIEKPSLINLLVLSLINFLIIYSHYISGIVLLMQFLFIGIYYKKLIKPFISIQTIFICGLIFLRFTKKQFLHIINFNKKGDFWLQTATIDDLYETIKNLFYNQFTLYFFILAIVVYIYNFLRKKKEETRNAQIYCFLIGICPIFFLFFIGIFKTVFLDRYLIFCIPFATILMSFQLTRDKLVGFGSFIILFIIQIVNYKLMKDSSMDYRSISEIVKHNESKGDYIVINTKDNLGLFEYYYDKPKFLRYKNIDSLCRTQNIYGVNDLESLKEINFARRNKIFLIQSFHKIGKNNNPLEEYLTSKYKKVYSTNFFNGVEFNVFKN